MTRLFRMGKVALTCCGFGLLRVEPVVEPEEASICGSGKGVKFSDSGEAILFGGGFSSNSGSYLEKF